MRVLVLGGTGFLGRHVVAALEDRGHEASVGSRFEARTGMARPVRCIRFERCSQPADFEACLEGMDAVVNCVGILRERGRETYERVHVQAPAALAAACARRGLRLVHVSALGLDGSARSGFIRSKLDGERALLASGAACSIVRPSLLEGDGGFGARWIRTVARWPVHVVPADATGRIAALDVRDAGFAIARLVELPAHEWREVSLGGMERRTMAGHLAALRGDGPAAAIVRVPALVARAVAHACDLFHVSPFSFGHLELLRHDNVPRPNLLPALLGAPPRRIGVAMARDAREAAFAPGRASLRGNAVPDGGSTRSAPAP